RNMAQEIKKQHGVTMISVPWDYADSMIYEGFEKAKAAGRSGLENFHQLRSILSAAKPRAQDHPVYRRVNSGEVREGAWRELSRRLLGEPGVRFLVFDADWVVAFFSRPSRRRNSRPASTPRREEASTAGHMSVS